MARARNIKPGFFRNAELAELPIETRLLFPGLWIIADRAGRLEDRPKQIKMEIYPADNFDVDKLLQQLHDSGLILRYEADGKRYIQVVNFCKHQNPHKDEKASSIPAPCEHRASTVQAPCEVSASSEVVGLIPDSLLLIPSSLIPDSLIADSPIPESNQEKSKPLQPATPPAGKKKVSAEEDTALQAVCREVWRSYGAAYQDRYGAEPVRNAKISTQVRQFCQRVPFLEAPLIAGFYVWHNASFYVQKGHQFGNLLADAEKLRTEWVTQKTITQTQARQADKTQANGNVWSEVINEIKEKERLNAVN